MHKRAEERATLFKFSVQTCQEDEKQENVHGHFCFFGCLWKRTSSAATSSALYRCKYLQPHYKKAKPIMLHFKTCFICDCVSVSQAFELRGHASSLCLYHQCKNVSVIKFLLKCSCYSSSHLTWKHVSDWMHFRKIVASQNKHHGLYDLGKHFTDTNQDYNLKCNF